MGGGQSLGSVREGVVLTGMSPEGAAAMRGSSTSTVPPAPFRRIASTGSRPNMWSPVEGEAYARIVRAPASKGERLRLPTVCVGDEYLLHLANLHRAFLDLVLGRLAAVKEPDISI